MVQKLLIYKGIHFKGKSTNAFKENNQKHEQGVQRYYWPSLHINRENDITTKQSYDYIIIRIIEDADYGTNLLTAYHYKFIIAEMILQT